MIIAICEVRKIRTNRQIVEVLKDPIKFVDSQEEADKFVKDYNHGFIGLKVKAEVWTDGRFAEYMREEIENLKGRMDFHSM